MKHVLIISLTFCIATVWNPSSSFATGPEKDGKTIFVEAKCNMCHTVETADIEKAGKGKSTDLSNVGVKHNADFLFKYLKKQEMIGDKKHVAAFKGNDDDLKLLAKWLGTLKTAAN